MARPTKNDHEKRNAQLPAVRVTEAELVHLQSLAAAAGLTQSDFIRQRALSGRVTPSRRRNASSAQTSFIAELNRIGVNLNQIARQLNRGRTHDPHHLDHVLHALTQALEKATRSYGA